jgi:hypothetical protein
MRSVSSIYFGSSGISVVDPQIWGSFTDFSILEICPVRDLALRLLVLQSGIYPEKSRIYGIIWGVRIPAYIQDRSGCSGCSACQGTAILSFGVFYAIF